MTKYFMQQNVAFKSCYYFSIKLESTTPQLCILHNPLHSKTKSKLINLNKALWSKEENPVRRTKKNPNSCLHPLHYFSLSKLSGSSGHAFVD